MSILGLYVSDNMKKYGTRYGTCIWLKSVLNHIDLIDIIWHEVFASLSGYVHTFKYKDCILDNWTLCHIENCKV